MAQLTTDEFIAKARAHWTPEVTRKVTGGKKYPLVPGAAPMLLRELGLLNADATMSADAVRKFGQINHMLNLLGGQLDDLAARHKVVRILDAGCGSSFLTFLLAWWFESRQSQNPGFASTQILGVDSNGKLIEKSSRIANILNYGESLRFATSSIADCTWSRQFVSAFGEGSTATKDGEVARPNMVVALHACDTATDDAIGLALKEKADFIAVAPCCQAELAAIWKGFSQNPPTSGKAMSPVFAAPQLRREIAAELTDMLRVLLMRGCGYEVTATEFVSSSHTPKNRLITAVRRGRYLESALAEYKLLRDHIGGGAISLERHVTDTIGETGLATLSFPS